MACKKSSQWSIRKVSLVFSAFKRIKIYIYMYKNNCSAKTSDPPTHIYTPALITPKQRGGPKGKVIINNLFLICFLIFFFFGTLELLLSPQIHRAISQKCTLGEALAWDWRSLAVEFLPDKSETHFWEVFWYFSPLDCYLSLSLICVNDKAFEDPISHHYFCATLILIATNAVMVMPN